MSVLWSVHLETKIHIRYDCKALSKTRERMLGKDFIEEPSFKANDTRKLITQISGPTINNPDIRADYKPISLNKKNSRDVYEAFLENLRFAE